MDSFDPILNWKLKAGSHPFPGPDGGTCINEAALVAAGFPYRPIRTSDQMPKCFSRPICGLAMRLNDQADDEERQRLLPYVTRLACADTPAVESERAAYIYSHTCYHYISEFLFAPIPLAFEEGLKALEGALAIGRQADPLGPDEVKTRMEEAKAGKCMRQPNRPFFSQVKSWLAMKETEAAS